MVFCPFIRQAADVLKENRKMLLMIRIDMIKCFVVAFINPHSRTL
jgi:hypothetical protein